MKDGKVSAQSHSSVGDPAQGGATCGFTFAGTIANDGGFERAKITAVDGYDSVRGELRALGGGDGAVTGLEISLHLDKSLNACARVSPELTGAQGVKDRAWRAR